MKRERSEVEAEVERIVSHVFGTPTGEIGPDQSFAEDLLAESLDYVDMGLHISQTFGIEFDFGEAAERMRAEGVGTIRVRDLVEHLVRRLETAGPARARGGGDG